MLRYRYIDSRRGLTKIYSLYLLCIWGQKIWNAAKYSAFLFYVPFVSCYTTHTGPLKFFVLKPLTYKHWATTSLNIPLLCAAQVMLKASVETHCGFSNTCWFSTFLLSWDVSLDWNIEIKWNSEMENGMEQLMYTIIASSCNWRCCSSLCWLGSYLTAEGVSLYEQVRFGNIHKDNSIITALQTQTLAFCTRVWLCKTTIAKHLTVGIAVLAHKACGEITALEIHWLVQLTLSSTSYTS